MRAQPLICVTDVEASSRWRQRLLGRRSVHGGKEHERLAFDDSLILQWRRFEVDRHHGPIGDPDDKPYGNDILLWFEVDDFDAAIARVSPSDRVQVGHLATWPPESRPSPRMAE